MPPPPLTVKINEKRGWWTKKSGSSTIKDQRGPGAWVDKELVEGRNLIFLSGWPSGCAGVTKKRVRFGDMSLHFKIGKVVQLHVTEKSAKLVPQERMLGCCFIIIKNRSIYFSLWLSNFTSKIKNTRYMLIKRYFLHVSSK